MFSSVADGALLKNGKIAVRTGYRGKWWNTGIKNSDFI